MIYGHQMLKPAACDDPLAFERDVVLREMSEVQPDGLAQYGCI